MACIVHILCPVKYSVLRRRICKNLTVNTFLLFCLVTDSGQGLAKGSFSKSASQERRCQWGGKGKRPISRAFKECEYCLLPASECFRPASVCVTQASDGVWLTLKKLYFLFQKSLKIKWGLICWPRLHNISFLIFYEVFVSGEQLDSEKSYGEYFLRMHRPGNRPKIHITHLPIDPDGDFGELIVSRPRTNMVGVCRARSSSSTQPWNRPRQKQAKIKSPSAFM